MSEQTANGRNANGRKHSLHEIIIAALLAAFFAALIASDQRLANRMSELERKVDRNTLLLVKMQTTLDVIASGLNIRVEPKEQAGPAAATTPNEKLATKAP